jgi:hypothetical protein
MLWHRASRMLPQQENCKKTTNGEFVRILAIAEIRREFSVSDIRREVPWRGGIR